MKNDKLKLLEAIGIVLVVILVGFYLGYKLFNLVNYSNRNLDFTYDEIAEC